MKKLIKLTPETWDNIDEMATALSRETGKKMTTTDMVRFAVRKMLDEYKKVC